MLELRFVTSELAKLGWLLELLLLLKFLLDNPWLICLESLTECLLLLLLLLLLLRHDKTFIDALLTLLPSELSFCETLLALEDLLWDGFSFHLTSDVLALNFD